MGGVRSEAAGNFGEAEVWVDQGMVWRKRPSGCASRRGGQESKEDKRARENKEDGVASLILDQIIDFDRHLHSLYFSRDFPTQHNLNQNALLCLIIEF